VASILEGLNNGQKYEQYFDITATAILYHTVSYDNNGGIGKAPRPQPLTDGESTTIPSGSGLSKEGFAFSGWKDGYGTVYQPGDTYTPVESTLLYAKWSAQYKVTYDAAGGSVSPAYSIVTYDSAYVLAVPVRTGWVFEGWRDGGGVQLTNAAGVSLAPWSTADDATVHAVWASQSTLTYNAEGGSVSPATATVTAGYPYILAVPTKAGCGFAGWYRGAGGTGAQLTGSNGLSIGSWSGGSATVYARWTTGLPYTVTYDARGGTISAAADTVYYGEAVTLRAPERTGWSFDGWWAVLGGNTTRVTGSDCRVDGWTYTQNISVYAVWSANTNRVRLESGNNNQLVPDALNGQEYTFTYGYSYELPVPVREGYTFTGWCDAASGARMTDGSGNSLSAWEGNLDITLNALWDANTYTVTLDQQGGTGGTASVTAIYGSGLPQTAMPTRTGYTFGGYYRERGGQGTQYYTSLGTSVNNWDIAGNATLYAYWTANSYIVTLDKQGGTGGTASVTATYESAMPPAPGSSTISPPTKTGYHFSGYYSQAGGEGTQYYAANGTSAHIWDVADAATIYAKWTGVDYTVSYMGNGATSGTAPANQTKRYGTNLTLRDSGTLKKTGYAFMGWNTKADCTGDDYVAGSTLSIDYTSASGGSVVFYARWSSEAYTIAFDGNGNTGGTAPPSQPKTYDQNMTLPSAGTLVKTGYTLVGWNEKRDGSGTNYAIGGTLSADLATESGVTVTLYAKWEANKYTLVYNGNGSTGGLAPANQTKTYGTSLTLRTNESGLVKTGHTFKGWNTASDGAGTAFTAGTVLASDLSESAGASVSLYAMWEANTYTIAYNGATYTSGSPPASQVKTYGVNITLQGQGTLQRTNYIFSGWNTQTNGSGTDYAANTTLSTDLRETAGTATLYAQWTLQYTVVYSGNNNTGGAVPASQTKTKGAPLTLRTNSGALVRAGYTFSGWNTHDDGSGTDFAVGGTLDWELSETAGDAVTLYAKWVPITYTVAYSGNGYTGGAAPASQTKTYGESLTLRSSGTLVKTGHNFAGWNTLSGGTGTNYEAGGTLSTDYSTVAGSTVTLYAKWAPITYTIVYNGNTHTGGAAPASQTKTYGVSLTLQGNIRVSGDTPAAGQGTLVKARHAFVGWNANSSGTGTDYAGGSQLSTDLSSTDGAQVNLYAKWLLNTFTLTYDYEGATGGNSAGDATVVVGSPYTLAIPYKTGYTFGGWWTGDNGTGTQLTYGALDAPSGKNPGDSLVIWAGTSDATVYAKWIENLINLTDPSASTGTGYTYYGGDRVNHASFTVENGAAVRAAGSGSSRIVVNGTSRVTLDNVTIVDDTSPWTSYWSGMIVGANGTMTLLLSGTNTITARGFGAGINVAQGGTLIIDSAASTSPGTASSSHATSGVLNVSGGHEGNMGYTVAAAAIGGGQSASSGNITIYGGTINAAGGTGAAGIGGGGDGSNGGTITIAGGNVTATGDSGGAGIGGGSGGSGGTIIISGGTVNATGGRYAAGLGGGIGGAGGTISITGGTGVATRGADASCAVGYGLNGSGGSFSGPGYTGAFPVYSPYRWNGTQVIGNSYTIAYSGNGYTGGAVPASQVKTFGTNLTLRAVGNLVKNGYTFTGWNTAADGSGTSYASGASPAGELTATAGATVTLYAIWMENLINLADPGASTGTGWNFWETGDFINVFNILNGANIRVIGTTTMNRIEVDGVATLTLDGANISVGGPGTHPQNAIDLKGATANLTLRLAAASVLSGGGAGKAGIHVTTGRTLKITSASGDGNYPTSFTASLGNALSVTGGEGGAGIGGNSGEAAGNITIAGGAGIINAGSGARIIGPGSGGSGGTFNSLNNTWPTSSTFTWPTLTTIDLSCPVLLGANRITYSNHVYTVSDGANVTVIGSTTTDRIRVSGTVTITLQDASIELDSSVPDPRASDPGTPSPSPLTLVNGANLTLKLAGGNSLYSYSGGNGAGIHVPPGTTIKITEASGDGGHSAWLSVHGAPQDSYLIHYFFTSGIGFGAGAAIGGTGAGPVTSAGNITISGGHVYAIGGKGWKDGTSNSLGAAGIGGGWGGNGGNITINGGYVRGTGWDGGAGIGGGAKGKAGTININNPGGSRGFGYGTYSYSYAEGAYTNISTYGKPIGDGYNSSGSAGSSSVTVNHNTHTELDDEILFWYEAPSGPYPEWR
jgi:uncharacterized repeat protein (TIGR02543 family)